MFLLELSFLAAESHNHQYSYHLSLAVSPSSHLTLGRRIMSTAASAFASPTNFAAPSNPLDRVRERLQWMRRQRRPVSPAQVFFGDDDNNNNNNDGSSALSPYTTTSTSLDWQSVPQRLQRLVDAVVARGGEVQGNDAKTATATAATPTTPWMNTTTITASVSASATAHNFFDPFRTLFCSFLEALDNDDDDDDNDDETRETNNKHKHNDTAMTVMQQLRYLGWLVPEQQTGLLWRTLEQALYECIRQKIVTVSDSMEDYCYHHDDDDDNTEQSLLSEIIIQWSQSNLLPWINDTLLKGTHNDENQKETTTTTTTNTTDPSWCWWSRTLERTCTECVCRHYLTHMFDIVADYPDSLPAVTDLRTVLERTGGLQATLAQTLQEALARRLCHTGATTGQIIDVYVNAIRVLRRIDPSDRLLTAVAQPVRQYLKGRADTVRSIIGSLTGKTATSSSASATTPATSSDLYQELRRQDAKPLEDVTVDSDDEEECPTLEWNPPPSIHQPKGSFLEASRVNSDGSGSGGGDILAMLVSIYGSKELFVNEYRLMLADSLLGSNNNNNIHNNGNNKDKCMDYNVDQEVHTLELLKLRFGESSMRSCEVMLKDINDSKRTNTNIRSFLENNNNNQDTDSTATTGTVVDAIMLSHIFWPQLHEETIKHHPKLQYMLDIFAKEYARLKNPRVLLWYHQLGTVELEATVVDAATGQAYTKEFSCSPLYATLLAHFEDKPVWTAAELSNETSIPENLIQKRMAYWVSQKVIRLVTTSSGGGVPTYVLATAEYWSNAQGHGDHHHHHADTDMTGVSISAQEEEEMEVYLSYIVGMLTNLGSLPLKTIHNNLKTFVTGSDIRYNKTPQQLVVFLQRLCKEEKLECGPDGMYKLFKK